MANKILLLAATSALMLVSCSDDNVINNGGQNTPPETANSLNLKTLDAASQAARVQLPSATRGPKADRLQLVAKIAPIAESQAAEHNWSATGVVITGGKAYVSWHSNHQAKVQADAWGGAIDEININALATKEGTVITNTLISERAKFNNVVTDGTNLYFPITDYNVGAVVGRLPIGAEKMDTIGIPGSSANAIVVRGADLYAVTGYAGAAYKMPAAFTDENKVGNGVELIAPYSDTFGGKYIDGDYILGTTDANAYLLPLAGGEARSLGAPLKSTEKYAEAYDPANGEWYPLEGEKSAHYGKHTMAVSDGYIYVGGGKGVKDSETGEGVNGLRVYGATGDKPVWENGTNTTAVCVAAVKGTEYVFAATGAGLRVYEKFDGSDLKLFAYEVVNYDEEGKAIGHTAGTDAHSSNFVAVDPTTGMIFVACGQSGVYVFNLDPTVQPEKNNTGFKTTTGIDETQEVEEGSTINVAVPEAPEALEGKEFDHWLGDDGEEYTPGDEIPFEAGKVITLEPVWKDKEKTTSETGFKIKDGESFTEQVENGTSKEFTVPAAPEAPEGKEFDHWAGSDGNEYAPGTSQELTAGTVIELTPVYKDKVYEYTVHFDLEGAAGTTPADVTVKSDNNAFQVPAQGDIKKDGYDFLGWSDVPNAKQDMDTPVYKNNGDPYKVTKNVTLYPAWGKKQSTGGTTDPEGDEL